MDRVEKTIIYVTIFGLLLICGLAFFMVGCSDVPYSRPLMSIDDVLSTADDNTICLDDGFDAVCVKAIPGLDGKDGRDGKDGKDGKDGRDGKDGIVHHTVEIRYIYTVYFWQTQKIVEVEVEVPGPERVVEVEVPGPERVVEVEVPGPERVVEVEVPGDTKFVTVREVYLVITDPGIVIDTPIGSIEIDEEGEVVDAPEGTTIAPVEPVEPPANVQPNAQKEWVAYLHQNTEGSWQVGFIHSDYIRIDGNFATFTGADGSVDPGDQVKEIKAFRRLTQWQYDNDYMRFVNELFDLVVSD